MIDVMSYLIVFYMVIALVATLTPRSATAIKSRQFVEYIILGIAIGGVGALAAIVVAIYVQPSTITLVVALVYITVTAILARQIIKQHKAALAKSIQ